MLKLASVIFGVLFGVLNIVPAERSSTQETVKIVEIHAHRFAFEPSEITLRKDEPITIRLISDDVSHALVIEQLHINETVNKGHPIEFNITPTVAGDFVGQCGRFCGNGHGTMRFVFHVK